MTWLLAFVLQFTDCAVCGSPRRSGVRYCTSCGLSTDRDPAETIRHIARPEIARFSDAVSACSEAARLRPSDFEPWLRRGQARLRLDAKEERARAIADLTRAPSIRSNDVDGLLARGHAYFVQDDLEAAAADWRRALELAPHLRVQVIPWIEKATRKRGNP